MYIDTSNASSGRVCLNAAKADQLVTARTITLAGDASGSTSFDGSKNVTLTVDIAALDDINDAIGALPNAASNGIKIESNTIKHTNAVTAATASEGGAARTLAFGGSFNVPSVTYDAQGHITGKGSIALKLPANPNTDTKVTSAGNHYSPTASSDALLQVDAADATSSASWGATNLVTGVNIQRDAKGHVTGVTVDSIKMPANPNTDTHYTTKLKVGASATATANAAATNGNVYLNLMDNTTIRDSHKIVGSGATTVTSDANGVITIKSTDNNTNYYHTPAYSAGLDIATGTGVNNLFVPFGDNSTTGVVKLYNATECTTFTSNDGALTPSAARKAAETFSLVKGGTGSGTITLTNGSATQAGEPQLKWKTVNENTPSMGFAQNQTDGTFIICSLAGTATYQSGLAIGGGSGNLFWKGVKVATISDIPTVPSSIKNPNALTIKGNGTTSFTYDGSAAKTLNIKGSGSTTVTSDTSGNITISSTGTTYSAGTGLSLSGTTFNNTGVTAISGGSANGTIAVTIGSSPSEFSVTGLKSAAYTEASDYEIAGAAASAEANAKNYTDTKVAALVNGAPEALNTLQELADALGENTNFATDMATALGNKLDKNASGTISGTSTTPLTLKSNGTVSYLAFNNSSNTQLGYIGVNASKVLVYNGNTVYHSGNLGAASTTASGLMTAAMVTKLNSFTEGAEANQNAIAKVKVGSNTITAAAEQDTVTIAGSTNISVTANVSSKTVTISEAGLLPLAAGSSKKISGALGFENNGVMYGTSLPAAADSFEGQLFFLEDDSPALPTGGPAGYILVKNSATDGDAKWVQSVAYANQLLNARTVTFSGGATGSFSFNGSGNVSCALTLAAHTHTWSQISDRTTLSINTTGTITASKVNGAVWNDYAEYREQEEEIKPGYCVTSSNDGKVRKTTEKFQACDGIVSDTFGFSIGETDNSKTPLAVAGRVLAYCEGNRYDYNAGDTVCAGPEGKVVKMTREEIREWPDRIVGIVSEIPEYEIWGSGNVSVDGRIWIKVK